MSPPWLKSGGAEIVRKHRSRLALTSRRTANRAKRASQTMCVSGFQGLAGINREPFAGPPPAFPEYTAWQRSHGPNLGALLGTLPLNTGPLAWKNKAEVDTDLASFRAALEGLNVEEAFLPAVAVGQVLFMVPT